MIAGCHFQTQSHIKLTSSRIEKNGFFLMWLPSGRAPTGHWLKCDLALELLPRLQSAVQLLVPRQVLSLLEQLEKDSTSCMWLMIHSDRRTNERDRPEHKG